MLWGTSYDNLWVPCYSTNLYFHRYLLDRRNFCRKSNLMLDNAGCHICIGRPKGILAARASTHTHTFATYTRALSTRYFLAGQTQAHRKQIGSVQRTDITQGHLLKLVHICLEFGHGCLSIVFDLYHCCLVIVVDLGHGCLVIVVHLGPHLGPHLGYSRPMR